MKPDTTWMTKEQKEVFDQAVDEFVKDGEMFDHQTRFLESIESVKTIAIVRDRSYRPVFPLPPIERYRVECSRCGLDRAYTTKEIIEEHMYLEKSNLTIITKCPECQSKILLETIERAPEENPDDLLMVCMYPDCRRVIRWGRTGPDGLASHGIYNACLKKHRDMDPKDE